MSDPHQGQLLPEPQQPIPPTPTGYDQGQCRSCNAPILWAERVDTDNRLVRKDDGSRIKVPLDRRPAPDGGWKLTGNGRARTIGNGELVPTFERYVNHFITCPDRDKHRKRFGK